MAPLTEENLARLCGEAKAERGARDVDLTTLATTLTHSSDPGDGLWTGTGLGLQLGQLWRRQRMRSYPAWQFEEQCRREHAWLLKVQYQTSDQTGCTTDKVWTMARRSIRTRWAEQGIWKSEWDSIGTPFGPWAHETSMSRGPRATGSLAADAGGDVVGGPGQSRRPSQELGASAQDSSHGPRSMWRDDMTEPSRPLPQFEAQVRQRCERARWQSSPAGARTAGHHESYTEACEAVRRDWTRQGIWRRAWGSAPCPSATWKHEHPVAEILAEEMVASGTGPGSVCLRRQQLRPDATHSQTRLRCEPNEAGSRQRDSMEAESRPPFTVPEPRTSAATSNDDSHQVSTRPSEAATGPTDLVDSFSGKSNAIHKWLANIPETGAAVEEHPRVGAISPGKKRLKTKKPRFRAGPSSSWFWRERWRATGNLGAGY
ncbi:hypothetical protein JDV02_008877 [Purpureocillium takamizusanense]|uniref:Uncharacterized protein n=1 Tax=Purpureocillium takamizusanense TaxID=2060973 RepID=A0A9Q8QL14_9HYPO|nr:uncharacterized protein JDV02_008877 [Purpureocillium takamizusanense]UNI23034.1 hypothetical protein JDV02_008877 [Purpureocillium takamizusanense]